MFNWRKIFAPTASDLFAPHMHMQQLADSITAVVPVASLTERAAVLTRMVNEGKAPSADNPLIVYRGDAPASARLEITDDGSTWQTFGRPKLVGATGLVGSVPAGVGAYDYVVTETVKPDSTGTYEITWPPFPNAIVGIQATLRDPGALAGNPVSVAYTDVGLGGCAIVLKNAEGETRTTAGSFPVSVTVTGA